MAAAKKKTPVRAKKTRTPRNTPPVMPPDQAARQADALAQVIEDVGESLSTIELHLIDLSGKAERIARALEQLTRDKGLG